MRRAQRLHPYLSTGNRERNEIMGLEEYLMILFLLAWSDARIDEIIAFRIYSRSQVTRCKAMVKKVKGKNLSLAH